MLPFPLIKMPFNFIRPVSVFASALAVGTEVRDKFATLLVIKDPYSLTMKE